MDHSAPGQKGAALPWLFIPLILSRQVPDWDLKGTWIGSPCLPPNNMLQMVGCTRRGCWCGNGCHMGKVCSSNCGPFKDLWWSVEDFSLLAGVFLVYIKCMTTDSNTQILFVLIKRCVGMFPGRNYLLSAPAQHRGHNITHLSARALKLQAVHMSTGGTSELESVSLALSLAGAGI